MFIDAPSLPQLAQRLMKERKRQGLSREQAAAVCNVSPSFIRDAESNPARCSLLHLLQLTQGLGLKFAITGWQAVSPEHEAGIKTATHDRSAVKP